MATVNLAWDANPADEQVTAYNVYKDGTLAGTTQETSYGVANVDPGLHAFTVAAVNIWGEGPQSDPVSTPAPCTKVNNVTINITINM